MYFEKFTGMELEQLVARGMRARTSLQQQEAAIGLATESAAEGLRLRLTDIGAIGAILHLLKNTADRTVQRYAAFAAGSMSSSMCGFLDMIEKSAITVLSEFALQADADLAARHYALLAASNILAGDQNPDTAWHTWNEFERAGGFDALMAILSTAHVLLGRFPCQLAAHIASVDDGLRQRMLDGNAVPFLSALALCKHAPTQAAAMRAIRSFAANDDTIPALLEEEIWGALIVCAALPHVPIQLDAACSFAAITAHDSGALAMCQHASATVIGLMLHDSPDVSEAATSALANMTQHPRLHERMCQDSALQTLAAVLTGSRPATQEQWLRAAAYLAGNRALHQQLMDVVGFSRIYRGLMSPSHLARQFVALCIGNLASEWKNHDFLLASNCIRDLCAFALQTSINTSAARADDVAAPGIFARKYACLGIANLSIDRRCRKQLLQFNVLAALNACASLPDPEARYSVAVSFSNLCSDPHFQRAAIAEGCLPTILGLCREPIDMRQNQLNALSVEKDEDGTGVVDPRPTASFAAAALRGLAAAADCCEAVGLEGGIPVLLELISAQLTAKEPVETVLVEASGAIANLALADENKYVLLREGASRVLLRLCLHSSVTVAYHATCALADMSQASECHSDIALQIVGGDEDGIPEADDDENDGANAAPVDVRGLAAEHLAVRGAVPCQHPITDEVPDHGIQHPTTGLVPVLLPEGSLEHLGGTQTAARDGADDGGGNGTTAGAAQTTNVDEVEPAEVVARMRRQALRRASRRAIDIRGQQTGVSVLVNVAKCGYIQVAREALRTLANIASDERTHKALVHAEAVKLFVAAMLYLPTELQRAGNSQASFLGLSQTAPFTAGVREHANGTTQSGEGSIGGFTGSGLASASSSTPPDLLCVRSAVLGIANCARNADMCGLMLRQGVLPPLMDIIGASYCKSSKIRGPESGPVGDDDAADETIQFETTRFALLAFAQLGSDPSTHPILLSRGTIHDLMSLSDHKDHAVRQYAAYALARIGTSPSIRKALSEAGAVEAILYLVRLAHAQELAVDIARSKQRMHQGATLVENEQLAAATELSEHSATEVYLELLTALTHLSFVDSHKRTITIQGGLHLVCCLLSHPDPGVLRDCCALLANLSEPLMCHEHVLRAGAAHLLTQVIMSCDDTPVLQQACRAVANLCRDDRQGCCDLFVSAGLLPRLHSINWCDEPTCRRMAAAALANITASPNGILGTISIGAVAGLAKWMVLMQDPPYGDAYVDPESERHVLMVLANICTSEAGAVQVQKHAMRPLLTYCTRYNTTASTATSTATAGMALSLRSLALCVFAAMVQHETVRSKLSHHKAAPHSIDDGDDQNGMVDESAIAVMLETAAAVAGYTSVATSHLSAVSLLRGLALRRDLRHNIIENGALTVLAHALQGSDVTEHSRRSAACAASNLHDDTTTTAIIGHPVILSLLAAASSPFSDEATRLWSITALANSAEEITDEHQKQVAASGALEFSWKTLHHHDHRIGAAMGRAATGAHNQSVHIIQQSLRLLALLACNPHNLARMMLPDHNGQARMEPMLSTVVRYLQHEEPSIQMLARFILAGIAASASTVIEAPIVLPASLNLSTLSQNLLEPLVKIAVAGTLVVRRAASYALAAITHLDHPCTLSQHAHCVRPLMELAGSADPETAWQAVIALRQLAESHTLARLMVQNDILGLLQALSSDAAGPPGLVSQCLALIENLCTLQPEHLRLQVASSSLARLMRVHAASPQGSVALQAARALARVSEDAETHENLIACGGLTIGIRFIQALEADTHHGEVTVGIYFARAMHRFCANLTASVLRLPHVAHGSSVSTLANVSTDVAADASTFADVHILQSRALAVANLASCPEGAAFICRSEQVQKLLRRALGEAEDADDGARALENWRHGAERADASEAVLADDTRPRRPCIQVYAATALANLTSRPASHSTLIKASLHRRAHELVALGDASAGAADATVHPTDSTCLTMGDRSKLHTAGLMIVAGLSASDEGRAAIVRVMKRHAEGALGGVDYGPMLVAELRSAELHFKDAVTAAGTHATSIMTFGHKQTLPPSPEDNVFHAAAAIRGISVSPNGCELLFGCKGLLSSLLRHLRSPSLRVQEQVLHSLLNLSTSPSFSDHVTLFAEAGAGDHFLPFLSSSDTLHRVVGALALGHITLDGALPVVHFGAGNALLPRSVGAPAAICPSQPGASDAVEASVMTEDVRTVALAIANMCAWPSLRPALISSGCLRPLLQLSVSGEADDSMIALAALRALVSEPELRCAVGLQDGMEAMTVVLDRHFPSPFCPQQLQQRGNQPHSLNFGSHVHLALDIVYALTLSQPVLDHLFSHGATVEGNESGSIRGTIAVIHTALVDKCPATAVRAAAIVRNLLRTTAGRRAPFAMSASAPVRDASSTAGVFSFERLLIIAVSWMPSPESQQSRADECNAVLYPLFQSMLCLASDPTSSGLQLASLTPLREIIAMVKRLQDRCGACVLGDHATPNVDPPATEATLRIARLVLCAACEGAVTCTAGFTDDSHHSGSTPNPRGAVELRLEDVVGGDGARILACLEDDLVQVLLGPSNTPGTPQSGCNSTLDVWLLASDELPMIVRALLAIIDLDHNGSAAKAVTQALMQRIRSELDPQSSAGGRLSLATCDAITAACSPSRPSIAQNIATILLERGSALLPSTSAPVPSTTDQSDHAARLALLHALLAVYRSAQCPPALLPALQQTILANTDTSLESSSSDVGLSSFACTHAACSLATLAFGPSVPLHVRLTASNIQWILSVFEPSATLDASTSSLTLAAYAASPSFVESVIQSCSTSGGALDLGLPLSLLTKPLFAAARTVTVETSPRDKVFAASMRFCAVATSFQASLMAQQPAKAWTKELLDTLYQFLSAARPVLLYPGLPSEVMVDACIVLRNTSTSMRATKALLKDDSFPSFVP